MASFANIICCRNKEETIILDMFFIMFL
jgi:hypothetical protein